MKNVNNPGQPKDDSALAVTVTIDEAPLLKSLIERLAHHRYDIGHGHVEVSEGWEAIDTSSIEAYISGCMDIQDTEGYVALAYTTCFSFTCTKTAGGNNSLVWANSLS